MTKSVKLTELSELIERIEDLEDEVYSEYEIDSKGNRVYTFAYPVDMELFMFTPSDTANCRIIELNLNYYEDQTGYY
jgi:hypothetical protein